MKDRNISNKLLLTGFILIIFYAIINLVISYYVLNCSGIEQYIALLEIDIVKMAYIARVVINFMARYYQVNNILILLIISMNIIDFIFIILIFSTTLLYMYNKYKYYKTFIFTNIFTLLSYGILSSFILLALNSLKLSTAFNLFNTGIIIFAIINLIIICISILTSYKIVKKTNDR